MCSTTQKLATPLRLGFMFIYFLWRPHYCRHNWLNRWPIVINLIISPPQRLRCGAESSNSLITSLVPLAISPHPEAVQELPVISLANSKTHRKKWQPTPVILPGKFYGQRSLVSYGPWCCKEAYTTEWLNNNMLAKDSGAPTCPVVRAVPLNLGHFLLQGREDG